MSALTGHGDQSCLVWERKGAVKGVFSWPWCLCRHSGVRWDGMGCPAVPGSPLGKDEIWDRDMLTAGAHGKSSWETSDC